MAGGLFNRPFTFNMKCVFYALFNMVLLMVKPEFTSTTSQYITLTAVFAASYVLMAWYDAYFECSSLLFQRGSASLLSTLKPEAPAVSDYEPDDDSEHKKHHLLVYLLHIFIVAPLLLYIGLQKQATPAQIYPVLVATAVLTALYHGAKMLFSSSLT